MDDLIPAMERLHVKKSYSQPLLQRLVQCVCSSHILVVPGTDSGSSGLDRRKEGREGWGAAAKGGGRGRDRFRPGRGRPRLP